MLKTPRLIGSAGNPILAIMASVGGRALVDAPIEEGVMEISHFSGDMMIWGGNSPKFYMGFPHIEGAHCFGVCDTPQQFLAKFKEQLVQDVRTFFVTFTHVAKNPDNKGQGGGWRWHKWGEYIGEGKPDYEYLDDEVGFENGVYCYHIYQTDGPEIKPQWEIDSDRIHAEVKAKREGASNGG